MELNVDATGATPPYEQVRAQIAAAIETGELAAEQRLPTVRALAAELGLAVNTVARAYRELETAGRVETRGRNGTFVLGAPSRALVAAQRVTADYVIQMADLGLNPQQTLALLRRELGLGA